VRVINTTAYVTTDNYSARRACDASPSLRNDNSCCLSYALTNWETN